ncbi:hypothetical protein [Burkholderia glumae]|uniref:hypothetical protein n=1 Tax=Burkholderia glumae TaxID=337 RepID=UPI000317BA95|nr:hypothetical protein [Burkholderia glumae]
MSHEERGAGAGPDVRANHARQNCDEISNPDKVYRNETCAAPQEKDQENSNARQQRRLAILKND